MVTVERDGSLTFRVYLPHAQRVELVADFTDWGTGRLALRREDEQPAVVDWDAEATSTTDKQDGTEQGWWSVRVQAPDGDHAFSYLIDDQWWLPDYAAHGVMRNAEGHWTSLLFVPPKPRLVARLERRRGVLSRSDEVWRHAQSQ